MIALRGLLALVVALGGAAAQAPPAERPSTGQPQCPPPPPGAAQQPPPPGANISGSSICGATIVGGTITGATIVGGTISGSSISGGTISGANGAPPAPPPNQPAAVPAPNQPAAPKGDEPSRAPAQAVPAAPPKPKSNAQPGSAARGETSREKRKQAGSGGDADTDDDDEADLAARALERALVQRGALLLPEWGFEIAPAISYGHTSQDAVATIAPSADAAPVTVETRRRTHQMTGSLTARLGLPFDFQIEASVPATFVLSNVVVAGAASNDATGFGPGDPRVSLTWQILHAGAVAPDLFIAGTWKSSLGSSPFDARAGQVGLGTGYQSAGGTLTAVKSADPLVLLVNAGYTANLAVTTSAGRRNPGDTFGLGGGAILAVSPDTSLSFLLDFHYKPDDRVDGKPVVGTDQTFAVLQLGLGRVLSRRVLMNVTAGLGLTADSPSFQLGVSLPIRF